MILSEKGHFCGHSDAVNSLCLEATDGTVFSCSDDSTFAIFVPISSGYKCVLRQWLKSSASALAWDPARRWLLVGTDAGLVQVFTISPNYTQCNEDKLLQAHTERVTAICFDSAQDIIVSVSHDKTVRVYDFRTSTLHGGAAGGSWLTCLAYDPLAQRIFVGSYDNLVRVFDISNRVPRLLSELRGHDGSIRCLAYDSRKKYLISGSFDATICIWDVGPPGREGFAQVVGKLSGHTSKVKCLGWFGSSRLVVSGGDDHRLVVYSTHSGHVLQSLIAHKDALTALCISDSGSVVSGAKDGSIKVWTLQYDTTDADS
eukprot:TRINITY_DN489_c0_g1_i11.p1 TRINITY_DN489_c0_g1~~TRINITY_DN489_c0_g1_i11.p1  ORF type:complete len:315 (-),score=18.22 TRINITY_DN489_c0_g1_i11:699-1643(-)